MSSTCTLRSCICWGSIRTSCRTSTADSIRSSSASRGRSRSRRSSDSRDGEAVSAEARKHADDIKAKLVGGDYVIFKGPIADNKGKTVIGAGTERGQKDAELEKMDYLVEGVLGATS